MSARLAQHRRKFPDTLKEEIDDSETREKQALDQCFDEALSQIAMCKAYRIQIKAIFNYANTASYLKAIKGYIKEEAKAPAEKINNGCTVYDRFSEITKNLESCPFIEIKKLSANQLYLALCTKWCTIHNESLRNKNIRSSSENPPPPPICSHEDFRALLDAVR